MTTGLRDGSNGTRSLRYEGLLAFSFENFNHCALHVLNRTSFMKPFIDRTMKRFRFLREQQTVVKSILNVGWQQLIF